jgi:hypothetical protein
MDLQGIGTLFRCFVHWISLIRAPLRRAFLPYPTGAMGHVGMDSLKSRGIQSSRSLVN